MKISEMMDFPSFSQCEILAGKQGIDNRIEWMFFALFENAEELMAPNNLCVLAKRSRVSDTFERDFINLLKMIHEKNLSGLMLSLHDDYIPYIPCKAIKYADDYGIPIILAPFDLSFVVMNRDVVEYILLHDSQKENEDIMNLLLSDQENNVRRGIQECEKQGLMENVSYRVIVGEYIFPKNYQNEEMFIKSLSQSIKAIPTFASGVKLPCLLKNRIVMLVVEKDENQSAVQNVLQRIREQMRTPSFRGITLRMGVSNRTRTLGNVASAYRQSMDALTMGECSDELFQTIFYDDLGIAQLLITMGENNNSREFYEKYLGRLVSYDEENKGVLVETLKSFISCDCHLEETADALYIHKNTLRYRLRKIEEISGVDLKCIQDIANIVVALEIEKINYRICSIDTNQK